MSVLNKIAYFQDRRDELPNQAVARELAQTQNTADIREIVDNLGNQEPNIQSDCLKVLYELGYLAPGLISEYVEEFLELLRHRNNRMVWGGMIALSTIAGLQADKIFPHVDEIIKTMEAGSVITNDAGIKALIEVARRKDEYRLRIMPYLLERLANSRAVDVPRYAENMLVAIGTDDQAEFIKILDKWIKASSGARLARLKKVFKQAGEMAKNR
jgi:hypothetical protein